MAQGLATGAASRSRGADRPSYSQILRSSALIGAASGVNVLVGMARTKAVAVLLGPSGVGLMGVYSSLIDVAHSAAGLGVGSSGVRQVADAAASGDDARIRRATAALRCLGVALAVAGAGALALMSARISQWTFDDDEHAYAIAGLSLALLARLIADSRAAQLQGLRRIADMAKIAVLGSVSGAAICVTCIWLLGHEGIVPALVGTAAAATMVTCWYSRRPHFEQRLRLKLSDLACEAAVLLKLGMAFMLSALLVMGAAFAVRLLIVREVGIDAAGLYQAAWTLGGLYVGYLLHAMGADFYPRLIGAGADQATANQLINEQTEASVLLAGPGVVATLLFASPVLSIFYSREFSGAAQLLQWICLGMALRVVSWPLGYILVAGNRRITFVLTELAWTLVNVGLTWLCLQRYGLVGAGAAFLVSYAFHWALVYALARRINGFRYAPQTRRAGLIVLTAIASTFLAVLWWPEPWAAAFGSACILGLSAQSVLVLLARIRSGAPGTWLAFWQARARRPCSPQKV